jgi:hypothetical protein
MDSIFLLLLWIDGLLSLLLRTSCYYYSHAPTVSLHALSFFELVLPRPRFLLHAMTVEKKKGRTCQTAAVLSSARAWRGCRLFAVRFLRLRL